MTKMIDYKNFFKYLKENTSNSVKELDASPPPTPHNVAMVQHANVKKPSGIVDEKTRTNALIVVATLWGEARGEGEVGMQAVLNVIMNRSNNNFDKAKDVVLRPKQFSMWNKVQDPLKASLNLAKTKWNDKSYQIALKLVDKALKNELKDITNKSTFYFNPKIVKPSWSKKLVKTKTIGNHEFYAVPSKINKNKINKSV